MQLLLQLARRLILFAEPERFVEGIADVQIKTPAAKDGGWIPEEIEIVGELRVMSGLFFPLISIDCPAHLEVAPGGKVNRVVVRLPNWLRDALRKCFKWNPGDFLGISAAGRTSPREARPSGFEVPTGQRRSATGPTSRTSRNSESGSGDPSASRNLGGKRVKLSEDILDDTVVARPPPLRLGDSNSSRSFNSPNRSQEGGSRPSRSPIASRDGGGGGGGGVPSAASRAAPETSLEPLVVEVHGLKVHFRTYTKEEVREIRRKIIDEVLLETLNLAGIPLDGLLSRACGECGTRSVPSKAKSGSQSASSPEVAASHIGAVAGHPPSDAPTPPMRKLAEDLRDNLSWMPIHSEALISLIEAVHENCRVELCGAEVHLETEDGHEAHLKASEISAEGVLRLTRDCPEETWFGRHRMAPRLTSRTLDIRAFDIALSVSSALTLACGDGSSPDLLLEVPAFGVVGIMDVLGGAMTDIPDDPRGFDRDPFLGPGSWESESDNDFRMLWRFSGPSGCRLRAPRGIESLFCLFETINAITEGLGASDPFTLASMPISKEQVDDTDKLFTSLTAVEFKHLWQRHCRVRIERDTQTESAGVSNCPRNACGATRGFSQPLSERERATLLAHQDSIPLVAHLTAILFEQDILEALEHKDMVPQLQRTLCHCYADRWKPTKSHIAVELGSTVLIELGDDAQEAAEPITQLGVGLGLSIPRSPALALRASAVGIYLEMSGESRDWRKWTKIVLGSLELAEVSHGITLLSLGTEDEGENFSDPTLKEVTSVRGLPWNSGVSNAMSLVSVPSAEIEIVDGCFAPHGLAGQPPWFASTEGTSASSEWPSSSQQSHSPAGPQLYPHSRRSGGSSRGSGENGSRSGRTASRDYEGEEEAESEGYRHHFDGPFFEGPFSGWPSRLHRLQRFWDYPPEPPRSLYVRCIVKDPIRVDFLPGLLPPLSVLGNQFQDKRLLVAENMLDIRYPVEPSRVFTKVSIISLSIQVRDNAGSEASAVVSLTNGMDLVISPAAVGSGSTSVLVGLVLGGLSMKCVSKIGEMRPVLTIGKGTKVSVHTAEENLLRETSVEITMGSRHGIRATVSPQSVEVGVLLTEQFTFASQLLLQIDSMRLGEDMDPSVPPSPSSAAGAAISGGTKGSSGASRNIEDLGFGQVPSNSLEATLVLGLTLDVCDAVSPLLRLSCGVQAALSAEVGDGPPEFDLNVCACEILGEFASRRAGTWEPFLEPWGIRAHVAFTQFGEMTIKVSDHMISKNELNAYHLWDSEKTKYSEFGQPVPRPAPLLINITPRLLRVVLGVVTQLQPLIEAHVNGPRSETSLHTKDSMIQVPTTDAVGVTRTQTSVSQTPSARAIPSFLVESVGVGSFAAGRKDVQSRISALNLSGQRASVWLHLDRTLLRAQRRARRAHWRDANGGDHDDNFGLGPGAPSAILPNEETLEGSGAKGPRSLDSLVAVPAKTAVAIQMASTSGIVTIGRNRGQSLTGIVQQDLQFAAARSSFASTNASMNLGNDEDDEVDDDQYWSRARTRGPSWGPIKSVTSTRSRTSSAASPEYSEPEEVEVFSKDNGSLWPRQDELPIIPLNEGWSVAISVGSKHEDRTKDRRLAEYKEMDWRAAWWRSQYIVQVLAPQPSTRLVLIASPLRLFNYTDRAIKLHFSTEHQHIAFPPETRKACTAAAAVLGTSQPLPAEQLAALNLPESTLTVDGGGGVDPSAASPLQHWHLPPNSMCSVPMASIPQEEDEMTTLQFRIACASDLAGKSSPGTAPSWLWTAWEGLGEGILNSLEPGQKTFTEISLSCESRTSGEQLCFRALLGLTVTDEPYQVPILSVMILPAFSVVNVTPAKLSVEVMVDTVTEATSCCLRRRRALDHLLAEPQEIQDIEPACSAHFYNIDSRQPLAMRFSLPGSMQDATSGGLETSNWSSCIRNVTKAYDGKPARVDIPFSSSIRSPTFEVVCLQNIAGVTLPYWLLDHSSLRMFVGRKGTPFPTRNGVALLDSSLNDIKLYLEEESLDVDDAASGADVSPLHEAYAQSTRKGSDPTTASSPPSSPGASSAVADPAVLAPAVLGAGVGLQEVAEESVSSSAQGIGSPLGQPWHGQQGPPPTISITSSNSGLRGRITSSSSNCGSDYSAGGTSKLVRNSLKNNTNQLATTVKNQGGKLANSMSTLGTQFTDQLLGVTVGSCNLPVPLTNFVAQGALRPNRSSTTAYAFSVVRDVLPPLLGEHVAPSTVFRIVPAVMVCNNTRDAIVIRQNPRDKAELRLNPGESLPYWSMATTEKNKRIQVKFLDPYKPESGDFWSAEVPCDVSQGRLAVATQRWRHDRYEMQGVSTATSEKTVVSEASVDSSCIDTQVFCLEVSDEQDGVLSISISDSPCLVVGCLAKAISQVTVDTDVPLIQHTGQGGPGDITRFGALAEAATAGVRMGAAIARAGANTGISAARNAGAAIGNKVQGVMRAIPGATFATGRGNGDDALKKLSGRIRNRHSPFSFAARSHGWPFAVGWFHPYVRSPGSKSNPKETGDTEFLWVTLRWADHTFSACETVKFRMSLWRLTPLCILRPVDPESRVAASPKYSAVILRLRPRAQQDMELHSQKLRKLGASFEECARLWEGAAGNSPDLVEVIDVKLDELADFDVQWICGKCGTTVEHNLESLEPGQEAHPTSCTECKIGFFHRKRPHRKERHHATWFSSRRTSQVVPTRSRAHTDIGRATGDADGPSKIVITAQLSGLMASVVSERLHQEIFLASIDGVAFNMSKSITDEECRLQMQGMRVDCQLRAVQRAMPPTTLLGQCRQWCANCLLVRHMFGGASRLNRCLLETPAILATTGNPEYATSSSPLYLAAPTLVDLSPDEDVGDVPAVPISSSTEQVRPALEVYWTRPLTQGSSQFVCMKKFSLCFNQRLEIAVDDLATGAALAFNTEVTSAVKAALGKDQNMVDARKAFEDFVISSQEGFSTNFKAPAPATLIQIEKAYISGFEVAVWFSINLARFPTSMIPASLIFVLKMLTGTFSESFTMDGSTLIFKEWPVPQLRWSARQVITIAQAKYQSSILLFVAKALGSSNILALPRLLLPNLLLQNVANIAADVVSAVDLSALTLDEDYKKERQRMKHKQEDVQSLQEGMECAADHIRAGFMGGMKDVVARPKTAFNDGGVASLPKGCCQGLLSCLFKPLDGIVRALSSCMRGVSAAAVGRCRRRGRKKRRKSNSNLNSADGDAGSSSPVSAQGSDKKVATENSGNTRLSSTEDAASQQQQQQQQQQQATASSASSMAASSKTASGVRLMPTLHGEEGLRNPRLLFGEESAVKVYVPWHAELLRRMGKEVDSLCALWRIAGSEQGEMHLVLCILRERLMLVDLNITKKRKATTVKRGRASSMAMDFSRAKSNANARKRHLKNARKSRRLQTAMEPRSTAKQPRVPNYRRVVTDMFVGNINNDLGRVVVRRAKELPSGARWCCSRACWRRYCFSYTEWRQRRVEEKKKEVLGTWEWDELANIEVINRNEGLHMGNHGSVSSQFSPEPQTNTAVTFAPEISVDPEAALTGRTILRITTELAVGTGGDESADDGTFVDWQLDDPDFQELNQALHAVKKAMSELRTS